MRSLISAMLLFTCSAFAQTWTQLPDFPGIARDDASAFAIGNDVFVGTGMDVGFSLTNDWYKYSTTANAWSPIAALPASGRQYSAAFSIDGIGYLFGGTDGNALAELWAYDPQLDQWTARATLPSTGRSGSAAFVLNGKGYIATGKTAPGFVPTDELWEYDPNADSWTQRAGLPGLGRALASAFVIEDTAYVQGGQLGNGQEVDDFWKYHAASNSWVQGFAAGNHQYGADGFGLWDRGLIICGINQINTPPYEAGTDEYVPALGGWVWAPPMFTGPGRKGGAGAVVGNTIYYGTGTTGLERLKDWYKLEWPVGIREIGPGITFTLGPVPADGELHVVRTGPFGTTDLTVSDLQGRSILRARMSASAISIATSSLDNGTYVISLSDARGVSSRRFTVQH